MSLKTFIDTTVKDFLKTNSGNLLFGVQTSSTFRLLPIYDAYQSGSSASITSIIAVEIKAEYPIKEVSRTTLANDLIVYDSATSQYLIDQTKTIDLEEKLYYLEFKNGFNTFETEPFLVKISDHDIKWDMTLLTWDSTLITFNKTDINI